MSTDPSNRANNWAAQRKQAIEKAKQTREERKFNLAKAGEMSVANEVGSTHLNRVTSSENPREYPKAPTNDFPLNSRKPATMKYGMSLLDQQPTEEELIQARTSLRLLKSKMKDSNGFPPMARTADQYMDHNQGERRQVGQGYQYNSSNNEGDNNGNYRKVFKPSFKDDDYNKINSNLNRDLNQIDKTLSQKSRPSIGGGGNSNYQSQQNYDPPQYSRPRDNGTKPPVGGNNRNNMYDVNQNEDFQDFTSKNIPSRLPKNTTTMSAQKPKQNSLYDDDNYSAQMNNKPKYGGYGGNRNYMEEENPIPRKDYQGYEYKPQQRVQENPLAKNNFESNNFGNKPNNMNKGWPSNANSNSNSYGNNAYNNRQQAFDDRESDNTAVFSKPNLKKAQPSANNPAPYNRQNDDFDNRPLKGASNNNQYNRQNDDFDNRSLKGASNNSNPYSRQPQNKDDFDSRPSKGSNNNNQYNRQPQSNNDDLDNRPLKGSNNNMPSEYAPRNEGPQIECPHGCGRSFNAEALEKHAKICQKVFQSKRKKFDSSAQREADDQGETGYDNNRYNPPKNYKAPAGKSGAAGGKSAKWKQQSEAFRANLKAARGEKLSQEEEVKLAKASTDHLVPCPSCGRKFNENAASRHIPFCESKQKVDNIKKGGKGKR